MLIFTAAKYIFIITKTVFISNVVDCHFMLNTARATMIAVRKVFGQCFISRYLWPPRSPDLTPPDFYL